MTITKNMLLDAESRHLTLDEFLDELGAVALSLEVE